MMHETYPPLNLMQVNSKRRLPLNLSVIPKVALILEQQKPLISSIIVIK